MELNPVMGKSCKKVYGFIKKQDKLPLEEKKNALRNSEDFGIRNKKGNPSVNAISKLFLAMNAEPVVKRPGKNPLGLFLAAK